MDIKTIMLGFLYNRSLSGYDIKQLFNSHIRFFYDASFGAIYPALRRLEEEGLVTKEEVIQTGKPNKLIYSITEKGRQHFLVELHAPVKPPVLRSDMLVKVYFSGHGSAEERLKLLEECLKLQRRLRDDMLHGYRQIEDELDEGQRLCWEYTLYHLDGTISFIEEKLLRLKEAQQTVNA